METLSFYLKFVIVGSVRCKSLPCEALPCEALPCEALRHYHVRHYHVRHYRESHQVILYWGSKGSVLYHHKVLYLELSSALAVFHTRTVFQNHAVSCSLGLQMQC